jgi:hypothetical protein
MDGNGRGLFEALSCYFPGRTEDYHEELKVRVVGVLAGIRTEHHPNTYIEHCRYMNLLWSGFVRI